MGKCVHYWILPEPDGETCIGICKFCGEKRIFYNGLPKIKMVNLTLESNTKRLAKPNNIDAILAPHMGAGRPTY